MSDSGIHGLPIHHGGAVTMSDAPPAPIVHASDMIMSDDMTPDAPDDDPVSVVGTTATGPDATVVGAAKTTDAGRRVGPIVISVRMSTVLLAALWVGLFVLYVIVHP